MVGEAAVGVVGVVDCVYGVVFGPGEEGWVEEDGEGVVAGGEGGDTGREGREERVG